MRMRNLISPWLAFGSLVAPLGKFSSKPKKKRKSPQDFNKITPVFQAAHKRITIDKVTRQQLRADDRAAVKKAAHKRNLMERNDYRKYKGLTAIRQL